jgi:hypothetical protein
MSTLEENKKSTPYILMGYRAENILEDVLNVTLYTFY